MKKLILLSTFIFFSLIGLAIPDLDIISYKFDKSQALPGEVVNASVTFKNIGYTNAGEPNIEVYLTPDMTSLGTFMFSKEYSFSLTPGQQQTQVMSLTIPAGTSPGN
jgi:hypothetical protein